MVKIKDSSINCSILILAAGLGKRMRSSLPKVLHEIGGKPLLFHVLKQVYDKIPTAPVAIVVGHGREKVEEFVRKEPLFREMSIDFIVQSEQLGTGHAARCAMESSWGKNQLQSKTPILVLPGDLPLIKSDLIQKMVVPLKESEALRLLVCQLKDATGYGRIVRDKRQGAVLRIVEERDASLEEKAIQEVATSIYFFQSDFLNSALPKLSSQNAQSELYLTDVVSLASQEKRGIESLSWPSPEELQGVNDLWELSQAEQALNQRLIREWAVKGVRFVDPSSIRLGLNVQLEEGVVIYPGAILTGETRIGKKAIIGPRVSLTDMKVGDEANIKVGTVGESSIVGSHSQVGPYAHLRPGTLLGNYVKIGNFVELKKTKVGDHTSIAHLSYLGDADVGQKVNIGCGFVTCNYDGRIIQGERKHKTIIEDEVFMGSDCQAVAPVRIGKGAFIASGSTITQNVNSDDLAIARSKQVNKPGYAKRFRQLKEE